jgi:hypothetical protein
MVLSHGGGQQQQLVRVQQAARRSQLRYLRLQAPQHHLVVVRLRGVPSQGVPLAPRGGALL